MKPSNFNTLDVVVVLAGFCAAGLVIYLKVTYGRFYLTELLIMVVMILGYRTFRPVAQKRSKKLTAADKPEEPHQSSEPTH